MYPVSYTHLDVYKRQGVASSYEAESKKVVWRGMFLGDYTKDLEWRDYDK